MPFTPTAWFDGVEECLNAYGTVGETYNWYRGVFEARRAVPTDVTIDLTGWLLHEGSYEFRANVCVESTGSAKTMRINMVQVLDHWPIPPPYSRNGFKLKSGHQDITVNPGECRQVVRGFGFDPESWEQLEDIKIIAWAQQPVDTAPAEVYQAASAHLPPPGIPTVSDWGMVAMTLLLIVVGSLVFARSGRRLLI